MAGKVDYPVKNLIAFDALENPTWRTKDSSSQNATVEIMISEIMKYHERWSKEQSEYDKKLIEEVKDKFFLEFITHVNREEEHGFSTLEETTNVLRNYVSDFGLRRSQSTEEKETINLEKAYIYLLGKIQREEESGDYGLLEVSLLEETHRIILEDIPPPAKDYTKPGQFSNRRRIAEFKGEIYEYQKPEDMKTAVNNLLDKYNFLFDSCTKNGLKSSADYYSLFKICAWLLFELLDLHPFSDGNGRLCRILCSYSLSSFTPFPTPIYNVWTNSSKDDYKQALVDTRKIYNRYPRPLTTMIIECSYYGWRNFFKELDEKRTTSNRALEKESTTKSTEG